MINSTIFVTFAKVVPTISPIKRSQAEIFKDSMEQLNDGQEFLDALNIGALSKYLTQQFIRKYAMLMREYCSYKFPNESVAQMVAYRLMALGYVYTHLVAIGKFVKASNSTASEIGITQGTFTKLKPLFETLDYSIDELAKMPFKPGDQRLVATVMRRIFAGEGSTSDV